VDSDKKRDSEKQTRDTEGERRCNSQPHDIFFRCIEGEHLPNANRLVQSLETNIDENVYNAVQLVGRCPPTTNKNP
jgi:hypothetical protein